MARIVVVGSVASDQVVRLTERCREGAHLSGASDGTRLGGGGANAARALAAAGHHVTLVTAVGEDDEGAWQIARLAEDRVDVSAIRRVAGSSTRSIVLVDPEGERTIVNLGRAVEAEPPRRLLDLPADLVYVRARSAALAPLLAEKGGTCPILAHIPPLGPGIFPAQYVVASRSDLDSLAAQRPWETARLVAGDRLRWMVLTKGEEGAQAFDGQGRAVSVAAPKVRAVDSTGAGDAFAAGLCHALAQGMTMETALQVAVRWGSAKVGQDGSALSAESVRKLMD